MSQVKLPTLPCSVNADTDKELCCFHNFHILPNPAPDPLHNSQSSYKHAETSKQANHTETCVSSGAYRQSGDERALLRYIRRLSVNPEALVPQSPGASAMVLRPPSLICILFLYFSSEQLTSLPPCSASSCPGITFVLELLIKESVFLNTTFSLRGFLVAAIKYLFWLYSDI